jgi:hypothetical protein
MNRISLIYSRPRLLVMLQRNPRFLAAVLAVLD